SNRYPISLSIDYPEKSNRLTTFFRIFTVIPTFIILALLVGSNGAQGSEAARECGNWQYGGAAAITFLPLVLMLLFRKKYPRWWFDWNNQVLHPCFSLPGAAQR
ncbi:hypothetical protein ACFLWZ_07280, partial [Chloroflexota bacterium]